MSSNKYEGNLRNTPIRRNRPNIPKDAAILINADNICLLICITSVFRLLSLHYEIEQFEKASEFEEIWEMVKTESAGREMEKVELCSWDETRQGKTAAASVFDEKSQICKLFCRLARCHNIYSSCCSITQFPLHLGSLKCYCKHSGKLMQQANKASQPAQNTELNKTVANQPNATHGTPLK